MVWREGRIMNCNLASFYKLILDGIRVIYSSIDMGNNKCCYNGGNGITINQCLSISDVANNTCNSNNYSGISLAGYYPVVVSNNTCDVNGYYGIYLQYTSFATIKNNTCSQNSYHGISLKVSKDNWIGKNFCTMNSNGIYLNERSMENDIIKNQCDSNEASGISLVEGCNLNNITGNICKSNEGDGINLIDSRCNIVDSNKINSNLAKGIRFFLSDSNMMVRNDISANADYGIALLKDSGRNHIFLNNLSLNNEGGLQAYDENATNAWDNGDSLGNYWLDYTIHYPEATKHNDTWSTPYIIDATSGSRNQDQYPLISYDFTGDNTAPNLLKENFEDNATTGDLFIISIAVSDNVGVNSAFLVYGFDSDEYGMKAMETTDKKNWNLEISIPANGVSMNYSFLVTDDNANILLIRPKQLSVTDNDKPIAKAASDAEIWEGSFADLDASGSSDNVDIVNYEWIIEDHDGERKIEGIASSAIFNVPGTYRVILRVEDAAGNWDNESLNVVVKEFPPGVEVFPNERRNWCMIVVIIALSIVFIIFISVIVKRRRKVRFRIKSTGSTDVTPEIKAPAAEDAEKTVRHESSKKKKPGIGKSKRIKNQRHTQKKPPIKERDKFLATDEKTSKI